MKYVNLFFASPILSPICTCESQCSSYQHECLGCLEECWKLARCRNGIPVPRNHPGMCYYTSTSWSSGAGLKCYFSQFSTNAERPSQNFLPGSSSRSWVSHATFWMIPRSSCLALRRTMMFGKCFFGVLVSVVTLGTPSS